MKDVSERKTKTEMERAEIFVGARVGVHSIIESNWTDWQLVTQTSTNRVAHVVQPNVLGAGQQIASVSKYGALQLAENWECVFNIEDGEKFSADRMTVIVVRAEIALGETPHGRGTPIEKTFIDGNGRCFVGAAVGQRMDNATARTERD